MKKTILMLPLLCYTAGQEVKQKTDQVACNLGTIRKKVPYYDVYNVSIFNN